MRGVLGSLLAAALLVGLAHSLKCHSCVSTNNADCNSASTCPDGQTNCFKFDGTTTLTGSLLLKGCIAACSNYQVSTIDIFGFNSCCTTDLCNGTPAPAVTTAPSTTAKSTGAPSVRSSYAVLYVAVGVTALLLGMRL